MAMWHVISDLLLSWAAVATLLAGAPNQTGKAEGEPRYDLARVVDISGRVSIIREIPRNNPLSGVHLFVTTESGEIEAYLGPVEFLKQFEITFSVGDRVQIIGSKVNFGGRPVVLARDVRKRETVLYLRNEIGFPNWPTESRATG